MYMYAVYELGKTMNLGQENTGNVSFFWFLEVILVIRIREVQELTPSFWSSNEVM
jgi:hypothetical protein